MQSPSKTILTVMLCVNVIIASILWSEWKYLPDGTVNFWFFDVGQGDAALIHGPSGSVVLIDGGPDSSVLPELGNALPFFKRDIDLLILTHPDLDHVGGLVDVLRRYKVHAVLMNNVPHSSETYRAFLEEIHEQNIPVTYTSEGKDFVIDKSVYIDVLYPFNQEMARMAKNVNNTSVTVRSVFGKVSVLHTGDIEKEVELFLTQNNSNLKSDILKVPHHGSRTGSSIALLERVRPSLSVIMSGKDNRFEHPHVEIVDRLEQYGSAVYNTAESGALQVTCTQEYCTMRAASR